jgi:hypothetical protein
LASLLVAKGEEVKTTQELLRHADSGITLQLYAQGDDETKRSAQVYVSSLFKIQRFISDPDRSEKALPKKPSGDGGLLF